MFDFRLRVFERVARLESFTAAAQALFISQPAVSKHIKALEDHWATTLFERQGNKVKLTEAGSLLLQHVLELLDKHQQLEFEMQALKGDFSGRLRIGASTTLAQYVLPAYLSQFKARHQGVQISLESGNTQEVEQWVRSGEVDLGFTEGDSFHYGVKYEPWKKDELVLVCRKKSQWKKRWEADGLEVLKEMPLVLRESGSGTLEVLEHCLHQKGYKLSALNIQMQLGSTESIKTYLAQSDVCAFLPKFSIQRELEESLELIDEQEWLIQRPFYIISHDQKDISGLGKRFLKSLKS
ncbi:MULTISPECIES: LysR family transcriptional regulator [Persicobacter]|uniref:Transcriptional regulator n=1 Tax=Persicobacter diffluens TaxID=981 RepID=A0AAN4VY90_9BACT|nr:LysR family transcriptional regulator [Persicobacter sp. CCB-QB2]GJM62256.1 transcriptional regulator [Persicobacter diffluens]